MKAIIDKWGDIPDPTQVRLWDYMSEKRYALLSREDDTLTEARIIDNQAVSHATYSH